jgi:hypothetical protein
MHSSEQFFTQERKEVSDLKTSKGEQAERFKGEEMMKTQ